MYLDVAMGQALVMELLDRLARIREDLHDQLLRQGRARGQVSVDQVSQSALLEEREQQVHLVHVADLYHARESLPAAVAHSVLTLCWPWPINLSREGCERVLCTSISR